METLSTRLNGAVEPISDIGPRAEALLLRYLPFIRKIVARLCPEYLGIDRADVEQQASIRLWRAVEHQREIRHFESYMYRVVSTATLDAIRQAKARMEDQLVIEHAEGLTDSPTLP